MENLENSGLEFEIMNSTESIIKVIGVGGGGGNAVNHMYRQGIKGVDFIVCNTDSQALNTSPVPIRIQLGKTLTEGRGAGMLPEVGMNAAMENIEELREILSKNTKMVFVTAGMGKGTGTGAAPVIAQVAKDLGILTVGIVTIPFSFEGNRRKSLAEEGLNKLRENVDTLLVINNDRLTELGGRKAINQAFALADDILSIAARGISQIITETGEINVDFNDVNTVMRNSGHAIMGSSTAEGENRAQEAVEAALNSPLLNDNDIEGARYVLLYITYGDDEILMDEISTITDYIQEAAGLTAEVTWGYGHDASLGKKIGITLVATGFKSNPIYGLEKAPESKIIGTTELKEVVSPMTSPTIVESKAVVETPQVLPTVQEIYEQEPVLIVRDAMAAEKHSDVTPSTAVSNASLENKEVSEVKSSDSIFAQPVKEIEVPKIIEASQTVEWEIKNGYPSQEKTMNDEPQKAIDPIITSSTRVIHVLESEDLNAPKTTTQNNTNTISQDEQNRLFEERQKNILKSTSALRNPDNITHLEQQPAFLRQGIEIFDETPSTSSNLSRFGLGQNTDGTTNIRKNGFLHDNVD
jgi:cell division protein FtsZ